jgi:hypothetical protein
LVNKLERRNNEQQPNATGRRAASQKVPPEALLEQPEQLAAALMARRVVRPSMALHRLVVCWATCGMVWCARTPATRSGVSYYWVEQGYEF